ncbi:hypothetical protein MMSR116_02140 [Methylobacterium mesophilicum SR1.6/6]|uniref:Uncharacterized protein n=1 Tax=Methylobacterium mesophilicum SR1.6/6 TaxID=908290 RepID=A0A6B9FIW3_9HYPH|nr:hypothetical protein MMSR116_02140 [Methylobacterium mesophilicum SR1.6/6]
MGAFPSPLWGGSRGGVVQKAPHRSILHHPHLQLLPTRGRRARVGQGCESASPARGGRTCAIRALADIRCVSGPKPWPGPPASPF